MGSGAACVDRELQRGAFGTYHTHTHGQLHTAQGVCGEHDFDDLGGAGGGEEGRGGEELLKKCGWGIKGPLCVGWSKWEVNKVWVWVWHVMGGRGRSGM